MKKFLGILPAAGKNSRLHPFKYPKELLPVHYHPVDNGNKIVPKLVIEYSLTAMNLAAVDACVLVVSDTKPEILRYLGDGSQANMRIGYIVQVQPLGLAHAVDQACQWASEFDCNCCLTLPDTIFEPCEAVSVIKNELLSNQADLVLGVFPTASPQTLGPVHVENGIVRAVFDKPTDTTLRNTWGVAAWTPRFSALLHEKFTAGGNEEVILGEVFDEACKSGFNVRAVEFPHGLYQDLGTGNGLLGLGASELVMELK